MASSGYKRLSAIGKRAPTPRELMLQGQSAAVGAPAKSVKALQKQGGEAPTFPGQGRRSVKSLMKQ